MWQFVVAVFASKMIFGRAKKSWLKYKTLKDLKVYGESVKCPMVPGENPEDYRKRLIELRNNTSGSR